jgi:hypothetical protein
MLGRAVLSESGPVRSGPVQSGPVREVKLGKVRLGFKEIQKVYKSLEILVKTFPVPVMF